ncbi:GHKL domain-containing protein [bacterium]|nr:GHKL domain-containing protein [bacterium]
MVRTELTELSEINVLPASTADHGRLSAQRAAIDAAPHVRSLCDAISVPVMILNTNREIVLANAACLDLIGCPDMTGAAGRAPGAVLDCRHAMRSEGGCGTTEACRRCGASVAIEMAAGGDPASLECVVVRDGQPVPLQLEATAAPLEVDGERYIVLSLVDRRSEQRQRTLERLFFHDVLNTAGSIASVTELLPDADAAESAELVRMLAIQSRRLVEEIRSQRDLAAAEAGSLEVELQPISIVRLVADVVDGYRHHPVAWERELTVLPGPAVRAAADPVLLGRALGNLIKNGLEAAAAGEVVTVTHRLVDDAIELSVHNPGEIPAEVAAAMFQRPVSTKGDGRGLGTYSVRLLVEEYLGGKVSLTTDATAGTTVTIHLGSPLDAHRLE